MCLWLLQLLDYLKRNKMRTLLFMIICIVMLMAVNAEAGRGCCSHHGGVCGCAGTTIPSCGC